MLIIVVLVSTVGFLTYRQFTKVLDSVNDSAQPDLRMSLTKDLLFDLSQAENSVKTYTLTHDSLYIEQYERFSKRVHDQLDELSSINVHVEEEAFYFDTLTKLIAIKFDVLDELLTLQNEFRVVKALEKVEEHLGTLTTPKEESKVENVSGFRRLFRRNKNSQGVADDSLRREQVNQGFQEIKLLESSKEEEQLTRELQLLAFDKVNTMKIQTVLNRLEEMDAELVKSKVAQTKQVMGMTNIQIIIFCVIICLLLILMSYTIVRYITNSNRYKRVLKKAKREAESLAKAKEHFVATVSHEIRTPMNIIAGFAEQLAQGKLSTEQKEQVNTITKASSHLLNLINEVLDFTKLQNNKLDLEQAGFQPKEVLQEVVDLMKPLVEAKGLSIQLEFDSEVPQVLIGDAFRLRQVLFNIIGNAVKFTNTGGVKVVVSPLLKNKSQVRLRFSVRDTGIGMEKDKINRVFQEFEQAEVSTTRTYGGTGLGLSITKKLVQLQEGSIKIESEYGEGTTVLIEIPYAIGTEEDLTPTISNVATVDLNGYRILVVDDERFNRKLLWTILEKHNALITEAKNGVEAVEEAYKNQYDVILMDARMPELDGVEATKRIIAANELKGIFTPIIALTAAVTEEDRTNYREAGMVDFIAKPFKEAVLLEKIMAVVELTRSEPSSKEIQKKKTMNTSHLIDLKDLKRISGNDNDFFVDMLNTFMESTNEGVTKMREAVENKRWVEVAEYAHKISAPCKHLGANELYRLLKEVEAKGRNQEDFDGIEQRVGAIEQLSKQVVLAIQDELVRVAN